MSRRRDRKPRGGGLLPETAIPNRGVPRRLRVERDLHQRLVVAMRQLRDERVSQAIITRVEMTHDLAFARIYVRAPLDGAVEPRTLVQALELATSRIRREVGKGMALRKTPELRFIHDTGVEAAERVEALLAEIRTEDEVEAPDDGEDDAAERAPSSGAS